MAQECEPTRFRGRHMTLSPSITSLVEEFSAQAKADWPNRWKHYERFKAKLYFDSESDEEYNAAVAEFMERTGL